MDISYIKALIFGGIIVWFFYMAIRRKLEKPPSIHDDNFLEKVKREARYMQVKNFLKWRFGIAIIITILIMLFVL